MNDLYQEQEKGKKDGKELESRTQFPGIHVGKRAGAYMKQQERTGMTSLPRGKILISISIGSNTTTSKGALSSESQ